MEEQSWGSFEGAHRYSCLWKNQNGIQDFLGTVGCGHLGQTGIGSANENGSCFRNSGEGSCLQKGPLLKSEARLRSILKPEARALPCVAPLGYITMWLSMVMALPEAGSLSKFFLSSWVGRKVEVFF